MQNFSEFWSETWSKETHTTEYALKRIKSAKSKKLTPVEVNTQDGYGYFQGAHGKYETFLNFCPCGDFRRSKLPCKHIYRLAIELGVLNETAENDKYSIIVPIPERMKLTETIDIIETLSSDAQIELKDIAANNWEPSITLMSSAISELLNCGIIEDNSPNEHNIGKATKKDLIDFLSKQKIEYDKKSLKANLVNICLSKAKSEAMKQFGETLTVSVKRSFSARKIYFYLHRKYDNMACFDDEIGMSFIPLLETDLADDDVTIELINRGYYSRK